MPLFICKKCGCIENTATSCYWSLSTAKKWSEELLPFKGENHLCSECATYAKDGTVVPGKWHGVFPKELATEEYKRKVCKDGLIH